MPWISTPAAIADAALLVPKHAQDPLRLTPAADEAAGRGDRYLLTSLVEEFLEANRLSQATQWFAGGARRPTAIGCRDNPRQMPVPALLAAPSR